VNKIVIVDYGSCNLDSIARAIDICGHTPCVTADPSELQTADRIILPGVGAFPAAMRNLQSVGMINALNEAVITRGRPFLGVCLGMHMIAERSSEHSETEGLGWIKGEIKRLEPSEPTDRIPHVGWNEVDFETQHPLLEGIANHSDFYFVHSYHFQVNDPQHIVTTTPYCGDFTSIVQKDNIFGVQFHPEKSQKAGARLLSNFLSL